MKELLLFCCLWYYNFHPSQAQRTDYCPGDFTTHDEEIPCGKRFTINCAKGCIRSMHHPQSCIPALFKSSDYFTVSQSPKCLVVKIFCLCRIREAKYSCAAIGRAASTVSSDGIAFFIDRCDYKNHCTITVGPDLDADPQCNGEQSQKRAKSILITDMVFDSVLSIFWFVGLSSTSLM